MKGKFDIVQLKNYWHCGSNGGHCNNNLYRHYFISSSFTASYAVINILFHFTKGEMEN